MTDGVIVAAWIDRARDEEERVRRMTLAVAASRWTDSKGPTISTKSLLYSIATQRGDGMTLLEVERRLPQLRDAGVLEVEETGGRLSVRIRFDKIGPFEFDLREDLSA